MAATSPVPPSSNTQVSPAPETSQYQSLYRRYRPQRFSEVRGQDLVASTLRNAVLDGRIVHAYLFSGPRGTGKTSTARILAKALNCTDLQDGEPCGRCESCVEITRGSSLDVHELDAASNNGVDAMRDLVARASLATPGKHKVYIVDEVHMLSTAASNALLKTLEEPPEHVVFVLATTDPQKVLPTIRSRTQHFEFHLIDGAVLEALLTDIAADAGLELPEEGIEAAVRRGRGSARDALSVLDQVAASGVAGDDKNFLTALVVAMAEQDTPSALRAVSEAAIAGLDAQRLGVELVEALRDQFLGSVARHAVRPEAEAFDGDGRPFLSPARAVRALELIGKALIDMREAIDPQTTLEVALVRLTTPALDESTAALIDRIDRLEQKIAELEQRSNSQASQVVQPSPVGQRPQRPPVVQPSQRTPTGPPSPTDLPSPTGPPVQSGGATGRERPALGAFRHPAPGASSVEPAAAAPPAPPPSAPPVPERSEASVAPEATRRTATGEPPTRDDLVTAWADKILHSMKGKVRAMFAAGRWTAVEGSTAVLALPNAAHLEAASPLIGDVEQALSSHFHTPMRLRLTVDSEPGSPAESSGSSSPATVKSSIELDMERGAPELDMERGALEGPTDTVSWAEHRVREVFPGIEEVPG